MKLVILKSVAAITVLATVPISVQLTAQEAHGQQPHYSVTRLGTLGGTFSGAYAGINSKGWAAGDSSLKGDVTEHGFLWRSGLIIDLGTLGGSNSAASSINDRGLIAGSAQTAETDPLGEFWGQLFSCPIGPGPNFACQGYEKLVLPYLWRNGVIRPLPTRGGNNGQANDVNNLGQVVGWAENSTVDPSCASPQILDIEAVIWGPDADEIRELPPFPGDAIAAAIAINDEGQVVGLSGICGSPSTYLGVHAVLWQIGSAIDLGGFGGVRNNAAFFINNRGQVVGQSDLVGDTITHAFLWQGGVITDLGTLPPPFNVFSQAQMINDKGQVAGNSCDASFNCLPFVWEDGVMTDLNTLIPPDSPLQLVFAGAINAEGQITGVALDMKTGEMPGFVATPCDEQHASYEGCADSAASAPARAQAVSKGTIVILPASIREHLHKRLGLGRFAGAQVTPQ
jgi:probable HAF family extracellular repeat protein